MADQDYPSLYAALEESADRAQDASVAFETMLGGDKDQLVPVRGFPDQPTLAGRVNQALTEILDETIVDALETLEGSDEIPFAIMDTGGRMALHIDQEGNVVAPQLKSQDLRVGQNQLATTDSDLVAFAIGDNADNSPFMLTIDGRIIIAGVEWEPNVDPVVADGWTDLVLGQDDTVIHVGDSYTAAHYVVKDKSYLAQLSALSPYRHINFGVSGDDSLDMQYRIVNGSAATGATFKALNAKYAFLTSLTNDGAFRAVDQTFYAENIRRLIDTVRAFGTEPVITTEFPATSIENAFLSRVAQEAGCAFIDCTSYSREVGGLQLGPFHQGHPGSRTGGVFWLPMLDFIDRMPKPDRAIKIYRRRQGFAVSSAADLLYKDRLDRAKRWKELTLFHYSLNPEAKYDELSQLNYNGETFTYFNNADEYQQLAAGQPVAFTDYGLLEITLPGNPTSLEAVELTLGVVGTAQVAVRNYLDVAASMPGKIQGSTPTDPTYLSKWDKPRGAWRSLGIYSGPITLNKADLSLSMTGNTLVVLLTGAFSLNNLKVRYKGRERKSDLRDRRPHSVIGSNLVAQPLCGTVAQQAGWTVTTDSGGQGPVILVPIDQYNAPRKPGTSTPIDGVSVINADRTLAQAVALPADDGRPRKYRATVWARYFPKAFLRPAVYPGLDPDQVIDRGANPSSAPITQHTLDLRTLKCEMWTGTSYPTAGGAEFQDFAALQWRPIHFDYDALPYITGNTLNFKLSCPDGEIQVGKVLIQEIQKWD